MEKVFVFWEGHNMPAYLKLCMETWKFPYIVLDYENLHKYTDLPVTDALKRFPLPMIADVVRAHVLRDQGGYYLDVDTVMLSDTLPAETIKGYPETKDHTWGFLHAEQPNMEFFKQWSAYQDAVIANKNSSTHWSTLCLKFTDPYIKHGVQTDVTMASIKDSWPETYMIPGDNPRKLKYQKLYFGTSFKLADFKPVDMLMLHNSWTPDWYKKLSHEEILQNTCTLSNILREVQSNGMDYN